jgi:hypothetical protein
LHGGGLKQRGDLFVGLQRGRGEVPGPTVGLVVQDARELTVGNRAPGKWR